MSEESRERVDARPESGPLVVEGVGVRYRLDDGRLVREHATGPLSEVRLADVASVRLERWEMIRRCTLRTRDGRMLRVSTREFAGPTVADGEQRYRTLVDALHARLAAANPSVECRAGSTIGLLLAVFGSALLAGLSAVMVWLWLTSSSVRLSAIAITGLAAFMFSRSALALFRQGPTRTYRAESRPAWFV